VAAVEAGAAARARRAARAKALRLGFVDMISVLQARGTLAPFMVRGSRAGGKSAIWG
jgi:hypothetical protein